jgi:hypothetical protein
LALGALIVGYSIEAWLRLGRAPQPTLVQANASRSDVVTPVSVGFFGPGLDTKAGRLLPLGGIPASLTDGLSSPVSEIFIADRFGFWNPDAMWDKNESDLVLVGDSFVFRSANAGGFSDILKARWPNLLNLGVTGNGPLAQLGAIVEFAPLVRPKVIIWFFNGTDLQTDFQGELIHPILARYLEPGFSQNLREHSGAIAEAARAHYLVEPAAPVSEKVDWFADRTGPNPLHKAGFLTLQETRRRMGLIEGGGDWGATNGPLYERVLQRAASEAGTWGGRILFVYLSDWYEVVARDESKGRYRDAGLSAARAQGLRILDLRKAFAERQKTATLWIASRPGYYSPDGNALVAEQIELALADMLP